MHVAHWPGRHQSTTCHMSVSCLETYACYTASCNCMQSCKTLLPTASYSLATSFLSGNTDMLGPQVWACVEATLANIDSVHSWHTNPSGSDSAGLQSSQSTFEGFVSDSDFTSKYRTQHNSSAEWYNSSASRFRSVQGVSYGPPPASPPTLQTASSLSSVHTMV